MRRTGAAEGGRSWRPPAQATDHDGMPVHVVNHHEAGLRALLVDESRAALPSMEPVVVIHDDAAWSYTAPNPFGGVPRRLVDVYVDTAETDRRRCDAVGVLSAGVARIDDAGLHRAPGTC